MQRIELSRSPVSEITTFGYYDTTDTFQDLQEGAANDYYLVNPTDRPAFVQPVNVYELMCPKKL